jgi:hypothetical protein
MNAPVYEEGLMLEETLISKDNTATYSIKTLSINDKDSYK